MGPVGTARPGDLRRLALVAVPIPGESLLSWLDAIARDYGIGRDRAAQITGITDRPLGARGALGHSDLAFSLSQRQTERIFAATDIPAEQAHAMTWRRFLGTALPAHDLRADAHPVLFPVEDARRFRFEIRMHGIDTETWRICPSCLAETDGRWPLSWSLPWLFACPVHRCYRLDHCPGCGQKLTVTMGGGICRRLIKDPDSPQRRCGTDLRCVPAPAAADGWLLDVQQRLVDHLADGAEVATARTDFADLWAMLCLALYASTPEAVEDADEPVRAAFRELCARRDRERQYLQGRGPLAMADSRSPTPLVFAAAVRVAASIVYADDPFEAADAACHLRGYPRVRMLDLQRAWHNDHLERAPLSVTARLDEVMLAAWADPFDKLSELLPRRFAGIDVAALERREMPADARYLVGAREWEYLNERDPELLRRLHGLIGAG
jgi:hypothetical protein